MQGTVPLLRSAVNTASQSTSKIPHLHFHIVRRQAKARRLQSNRDGHLRQTRSQSNAASHTYINGAFDGAENNEEESQKNLVRKVAIGTPIHNRSNTRVASTKEDVEAHGSLREQAIAHAPSMSEDVKTTNMFDILEEGLRDRILSGLMSHSIGTPFIQQADDQMFDKALLALDPEYFVEPFKDVERHWKGKHLENALQVKKLDFRLSTFALYLDHIVATRRQSGKKLDLEACNHLLRCAGSMGDASLARSVLETIMPDDGIEPTLESYNNYSRALVWSRAFDSAENLKLRVLPRILQLRASRNPPRALSGHKTSTRLLRIQGIRDETLSVFKDCLDKGYTANELTFTNLMISMGREADMEGVKSILKSVWNINVDLLETYDEEEVESPTFYDVGHPLRPSQELLFGIAHIFGSNNDVRTAWLLVDFISRNYDMPIPENVWQHLCEWAFVLSLRRTPAERKQKRDLGQIPQQMFVSMVEAMSDEPHNIPPNAPVHWFLCRSWRDKKHLDNTVHHVEELQKIVDQQQVDIKELVDKILLYAKDAQSLLQPKYYANEKFYDLRRRYVIAFFELQRNMQLINAAVNRHLLSCKGWPGSGKLTEWERRRLPGLIEKFVRYLPAKLTYKTTTGTVELDTRTTRYAASYQKHRLDLRVLPRILNAMDIDDQTRLNKRMMALPTVILRAKKYCMHCESIGHTSHECKSQPFNSDWLTLNETDQITSEDDDVFVLDPSIPRHSMPFSFEPGTEKELARPNLPFV